MSYFSLWIRIADLHTQAPAYKEEVLKEQL